MMALAEKGLGHADLDELIKNPQPLIFTLGKDCEIIGTKNDIISTVHLITKTLQCRT